MGDGRGQIPVIPPPTLDARARPLVSVMIPTYEPGRFLLDTLRSILVQDPGAEQMQVALVDDASPTVRIDELLAAAGRGSDGTLFSRVEQHRNPVNRGLAGNWNRCIELARGEHVHILHQDDVTMPGFYARLLRGLDDSSAPGMAFCRHVFVDESGAWTRRSHRERWRAGLLPGWLARISERQRIQCPAAIVRRSVYEAVGGFRRDLRYALDWEMWVRIAASYSVWYEPRILACYRRHRASETTRLDAEGRLDFDVLATIRAFGTYLPDAARRALTSAAYREFARTRTQRALKSLYADQPAYARQQLGFAEHALAQVPDDDRGARRQRRRIRQVEKQLSEATGTVAPGIRPARTSLIVTTYNSPRALHLTLASLAVQSVLPHEVIVGDDGSGPETAQVVDHWRARLACSLRHVWQEDHGFRLARIRNLSIAASTGDYIVLIDGDMVLHPRFVEDHVACARPDCFIQGTRLRLPPPATAAMLRTGEPRIRLLEAGMEQRAYALRSPAFSRWTSKARLTLTGIQACNQSYWREHIVRINGFDERFTGWGPEDREFAARLMHVGVKRYYVRHRAIAFHLHHESRAPEGDNPFNYLLEETLTAKRAWTDHGLSAHASVSAS